MDFALPRPGAVMITGATGGLGQSLARRLARERNFGQVVLAVRNAERGAALRDSLQAGFPHVRFALLELDVASLASVHKAAAQLEEPLDAIVLSVAEFSSWIDGSWFDGRKYDRGLAHGQTKLLGALWIGALARNHPELRTVTMSPGNTSGTGVLRDLPLPLRVLIPRVNALLGRSHSLDVGTERLALGLLDPAYGTGRFWASAPGKLTGPVIDQAAAHPMIEDPSRQDHANAALRAFFDRT